MKRTPITFLVIGILVLVVGAKVIPVHFTDPSMNAQVEQQETEDTTAPTSSEAKQEETEPVSKETEPSKETAAHINILNFILKIVFLNYFNCLICKTFIYFAASGIAALMHM